MAAETGRGDPFRSVSRAFGGGSESAAEGEVGAYGNGNAAEGNPPEVRAPSG